MKKPHVEFKSIDPMFEKEKSGIKNNTVRGFQKGFSDNREKIFKYWMKKPFDLWIEITNPKTQEKFLRKIRDITTFDFKGKHFDKMYIITFDNEE